MADSSVTLPAQGTGSNQPSISTRTNASGEHMEVVVVGIDGSDSIVGSDAANGLDVDVTRLPALPAGTNNIGDVDVLSLPALAAGTNNIGDVDVLTVPADPFGANADAAVAAGATGSIQSKLRLMTSQLDAIQTAVQLLDNTVSGSELQVDIVSGSSSNTEYTEGDTDATIIGGAVMWEDASDTLRVVSAAKPLPIDIATVSATAPGATPFRSIDLDESEEEVKGAAGTVYGMWVSNLATTTRFVKFYNATAANVTVGTTTPILTIAIPGNTTDDVSGAFTVGGPGVAFDTAITVAATTGVADSDTGAPAANDVLVNIFFD